MFIRVALLILLTLSLESWIICHKWRGRVSPRLLSKIHHQLQYLNENHTNCYKLFLYMILQQIGTDISKNDILPFQNLKKISN